MRRDLAGPSVARNAGRPAASDLDRVVWSLAWPVVVNLVSEATVGLVDTLMVGRLGRDAVAAVGVGIQILGSVQVVTFAIGTGTVALVARHVGAGEPQAVRRVVGQSIVLAFTLACPRSCRSSWTEAAVRLFGVEPAVVAQSVAFTRIIMLAIPASAVGSSSRRLRAAGDTRRRSRSARDERAQHRAQLRADLRRVRAPGARGARLGALERDRLHARLDDRRRPAGARRAARRLRA
jgi:O-antigen/teichoic acid export membrane protein